MNQFEDDGAMSIVNGVTGPGILVPGRFMSCLKL
jgi:hypothetical protein